MPALWTSPRRVGPTRGTITHTGGTLKLGGSFATASLAGYSHTAGTVNLTGALNNTGATFVLDPTAPNGLGDVTMTNTGTITGGTLVTGSGAALTTTGGTINSLTVAAGSKLNHNSSFLFVGGTGLTVDGTVNIAASTYLRFITDVTVGGSGVINVATSGALGVTVANKTLTIDSGLTVRYTGFNGKLGNSWPGATSYTTGVTVINRGRIQADTGGAVTVSGTTMLSSGTLEAITSTSSLIVTGTGPTPSMTLSGTVRAVGGSTVQIANSLTQPWSNTGVIIVDHATLALRGTFHTADVNAIQNIGGTVTLVGGRLENAGSTLVLDGTSGATGTWTMGSSSEIHDGTITTRNGAVLFSQQGDLYGVTISEGSVVQVGHTNNLIVYNGMTLNGRIEVLSYYGGVYFTGTQTLGGTGTVEFMWRTGGYSTGSIPIGLFLNQANMTLTIDEGVTVRGGLYSLGAGGTGAGMHLINRGTIIRDTDHPGHLTSGSCVFTNYGTVEVSAGTLLVSPYRLTNLTGTVTGDVLYGTLAGGTWRLGPGGTFQFYTGGSNPPYLGVFLTTLSAHLILDGGGSSFLAGSGTGYNTTNALRLDTITGDGRLTVTNGHVFTPSGTLTSAGTVVIEAGSTLAPISGAYTMIDGLTTVESFGNLFAGSPTGKTVTLLGGTLKGTGLINADVVNTGGTVAPGNSPGFLDITGNYVQGPGGTLELEIAGRDPNVPEFDRLRVMGTATLDGTARVSYLGPFQPTPGDDFQVLSSALRSGQFSTLDVPAPGGPSRRLSPIYDATGLTFQAQTVPPLVFGHATTADGPTAADSMVPLDVAIDAAGNSYVVGWFQGTVDFDQEHVLSYDTLSYAYQNGFVAKYDATGRLIWLSELTNDSFDPKASGLAVAVDSRGNLDPTDDRVYFGVQYDSVVSYAVNGGLATVLSALNLGTGGLLWLNADGELVTLRVFDNFATPAHSIRSLAIAPNGNVLVAGSFGGIIGFDQPTNSAVLNAAGGATDADGFAAEFVPTISAFGSYGFTHVRSGRIGGLALDAIRSVATDSAGNVWVAGSFASGTTNGLAALTNSGSVGTNDVLLLKLTPNGTTYNTPVLRSFGSTGTDTAASVAVDSSGNVILGGSFQVGDRRVRGGGRGCGHAGGDRLAGRRLGRAQRRCGLCVRRRHGRGAGHVLQSQPDLPGEPFRGGAGRLRDQGSRRGPAGRFGRERRGRRVRVRRGPRLAHVQHAAPHAP